MYAKWPRFMLVLGAGSARVTLQASAVFRSRQTAMQGSGSSLHRTKEFGTPQMPHWESAKLKRDQ